MSQQSISTRYNRSILSTAFFVLLIFSLGLTWIGIKTIDRDLKKKNNYISGLAQMALPTPIWNLDNEIVDETLQAILLDEDLVAISVIVEGEVLDQKIQEGIVPDVWSSPKLDFFKQEPSLYIQEHRSISFQGNEIAQINLVFSKRRFQETLKWNISIAVVMTLLVTLLILLRTLSITKKYIFKPLEELTLATKKLSRRELGITQGADCSKQKKPSYSPKVRNIFRHKIPSKQKNTEDEILVLQGNFDTMVQKIEADTAQILNITGTFEKFVPKQFLARITEGGFENIELGKAESAIITILFSDIRSFTNLSEEMTPQELLDFLNAYLKRMNQPIHENGGFIDKFIGDAIMALFDLPDGTDAEEARNAINAAVEMQKELKKHNADRKTWGKQAIQIGIGVHSGPVIIGTIGSEDRMDSTVLGDSVNLASRIEGLTKKYGVGILISGASLNLLENPNEFKIRKLDTVCVKGKTEAVSIYEVYDYEDLEVQKKKYASGVYLTKGLADRTQQNWEAATISFKKALEINPDDKAILAHLEYIRTLKKMELLEDWDGVISLDEK